MIQRERVADNVYYFQSDAYAQVNAGAVVGAEWAVVIDTLAFPEETQSIRDFIEKDLNIPVRYVINTHYHADHSWGTCFFPRALVISHVKCQQLLKRHAVNSLEEARKINTAFKRSQIVLPHMTFNNGNMSIRLDKRNLRMFHIPGHSNDGIGVLIEEDRVLFAGDVLMPLPYIVDGNIDDLVASLKQIGKIGLENIVQGHGDIILRGEVESTIKDQLAYLSAIRRTVRQAARRKYPGDYLQRIDVESCGKSRVLIGGLAEELHQRNMRALYAHFYGDYPIESEIDEDYY